VSELAGFPTVVDIGVEMEGLFFDFVVRKLPMKLNSEKLRLQRHQNSTFFQVGLRSSGKPPL